MGLLPSKGRPWSAFPCKRRSPHLIVLCVSPSYSPLCSLCFRFQHSEVFSLRAFILAVFSARHALPSDPHIAHTAVSLKSAEMSLLNEAPPDHQVQTAAPLFPPADPSTLLCLLPPFIPPPPPPAVLTPSDHSVCPVLVVHYLSPLLRCQLHKDQNLCVHRWLPSS